MPSIQTFFSSHKATTWAWLALICSTGVGWFLGHSTQTSAQIATVGVIVMAFVKIWIIGFQFMALNTAPRWLRHSFDAWIIIIALTLIIICLQ